MSRTGDYSDEMTASHLIDTVDDATAEALLTGGQVPAGLEPVSELVRMLRASASAPVPPSPALAAMLGLLHHLAAAALSGGDRSTVVRSLGWMGVLIVLMAGVRHVSRREIVQERETRLESAATVARRADGSTVTSRIEDRSMKSSSSTVRSSLTSAITFRRCHSRRF